MHPTTLSELLHSFHWLDSNGDGKLTKTEMNEVLGKVCSERPEYLQ